MGLILFHPESTLCSREEGVGACGPALMAGEYRDIEVWMVAVREQAVVVEQTDSAG